MKRGKIWHTTTRKGERVLVSPTGKIYYGTAHEVRDAALMPSRRNALAQSLRVHRYCRDRGSLDAANFAECCADRRMDAIQSGALDEMLNASVYLPQDIYIKLVAGSRLVADTVEEFWTDVFNCELDALLDVAEEETGKRAIPLNRYERAALKRYTPRTKATIGKKQKP